MLTLHNIKIIKWYGHLTSHNIFVDIKKLGKGEFQLKIRIAELELLDFMEYGNMFFNYRMTSVWSAPELLLN